MSGNSSVTVYDHPLSPYAQKVKIALAEKGVAFDAPLPPGIGIGTTQGDFAAASPRGEVPALLHGDLAIFDSTIILEYLEERWPQPALLPADPAQRARVRMLEDVMDTHFEAITWGLSEVQNFGRASGELATTLLSRGAEQIAAWYQWLEARLGEREWFNGDAFGYGDLAVVPYVNGAAGFGHLPPADSALAAWLGRANARPSVQACVEAINALSRDGGVTLDAVRELMEQGQFKREYRDHRLEWMIRSGGLSVVADGLEKDNIRFTDPFPA